jgi:hypothetical protein
MLLEIRRLGAGDLVTKACALSYPLSRDLSDLSRGLEAALPVRLTTYVMATHASCLQDTCLKQLDEYRRSLLEAGQAALLEMPVNTVRAEASIMSMQYRISKQAQAYKATKKCI